MQCCTFGSPGMFVFCFLFLSFLLRVYVGLVLQRCAKIRIKLSDCVYRPPIAQAAVRFDVLIYINHLIWLFTCRRRQFTASKLRQRVRACFFFRFVSGFLFLSLFRLIVFFSSSARSVVSGTRAARLLWMVFVLRNHSANPLVNFSFVFLVFSFSVFAFSSFVYLCFVLVFCSWADVERWRMRRLY